MKKRTAILLALSVIILTLASCGAPGGNTEGTTAEGETITEAFVEAEAEITGEGEFVYFGSYPQSIVEDEAVLDELGNLEPEWISYEYASGQGIYDFDPEYNGYNSSDGLEGEIIKGDFMQYADVELDGEMYRGVFIKDYRPPFTIKDFTFSEYDEYDFPDTPAFTKLAMIQNCSGFFTGEVYWFRYEPLKWRVLDPATGLVLCESVIDSQPYLDVMTGSMSDYYKEMQEQDDDEYFLGGYDPEFCFDFVNGAGTSANDWENSSIRAFLNNDFFNTAFDEEEQKIISETTCINRGNAWALYDNPVYDDYPHNDTKDRIFLLSSRDIINPAYGFAADAEDPDFLESRITTGTDYALCQGLSIYDSFGDESDGHAPWMLRTPEDEDMIECSHSVLVSSVSNDGMNYYTETYATTSGIRPAMRINALAERVPGLEIPERNAPEEEGFKFEYVYFGSYPQSEVKDEKTIAALEKIDADWVSYRYWSGKGWEDKGHEKQGDFMSYADVTWKGNRYRGVKIDDYRPGYAYNAHMDELYTGTAVPSGCAYDNGYDKGNTYWFIYEPVKWIVCDRDKGVLLCDPAIDAQPFNDLIITEDYDEGYSATEGTGKYPANDYAHSSLRKWLNEDFYNTAFSGDEQKLIAVTDLDITIAEEQDAAWDYESVSDRIYLLSYEDATDCDRGFGNSGDGLVAVTTDYARCQGAEIDKYYHYGAGLWTLRSPGFDTYYISTVCPFGEVPFISWADGFWSFDPNYTGLSVRPALTVTDIDAIS